MTILTGQSNVASLPFRSIVISATFWGIYYAIHSWDAAKRSGDLNESTQFYERYLALAEKVNPVTIDKAHEKLASVTQGAQRDAHIHAARAAWESIGRNDLVEGLIGPHERWTAHGNADKSGFQMRHSRVASTSLVTAEILDTTTSLWNKLHGMVPELILRIIVEQPPPGVDYALQKGKGSAYEPVQKQRSEGKNLVFEFQPSIRDGDMSLTGPFVQGPPKQRFIYLDIGTYAGEPDARWSRRLKIPLADVTAKMIGKGGVLETCVPGTDKDGGPTCATVKEFAGWKPVAR